MSGPRIIHSLITPRPTLEERFIIPTVNRDIQGHLLHRTLRFKTFKDIFFHNVSLRRVSLSGL